MSNVDVTVVRTIDAPVDRVAAYAGDPTNAPTWYRRIRSAQWVTGSKVALGSSIEFEARFLGRTMRYTYEIVEHEPQARLVMTTAEGPFPMTTEYSWRPVGDGATEMTLRNHGQPSGFSTVFAPVMSTAMRRAMRQDLARLAALMESPPS